MLKLRMFSGVIWLVMALMWGVETSPLQPQNPSIRGVQGKTNRHQSSLVRREEVSECAIESHFVEFRSTLPTADQLDDEVLKDTCSRLVSNLESKVKQSLNARNGMNCHCSLSLFDDIAELFHDKPTWTWSHCINQVRFQQSGGAEGCTDQQIMDCKHVFDQMRTNINALQTKRKRDLTPEMENLINEASICLTELQDRPNWPLECSKWRGFFSTPVDINRPLWSLQLQGCGIIDNPGNCGDPLHPYPDVCSLTQAEFNTKLEDYVSCELAHVVPHSGCNAAGQAEYGRLVSRFFDFTRGDLCPDKQQLEDIWEIAGCGNSPPWPRESDNDRRRTFKAEMNIEKKSDTDLAGIAGLMKRILGDFHNN